MEAQFILSEHGLRLFIEWENYVCIVLISFLYNQQTCGQNLNILYTKAVAWAGPSQGQALVDSFGLACVEKAKAASSQAGPEQHYYQVE